MASGAGSDVGGGGGGGGGPRLDGELYASIRARQETNLSAEVEGLVRETSALLSPAPATAAGAGAAGSGGLDADGNADARLGPDGQPESPAIADLRRAMKLLEQKEADLELAAKIGDALFQENTRLRKENQGTEALRDELDARDEELLAAREETKSLKRRLELLNTTLLQADASNSQLTEQLRSPGTTLEDGAADRVLPDSDNAVELAAQDLDVALERAEKWRTRALEAEAQIEAIGAQNADTIASLRDKVDVLEIALHRAKKERSRSDMLEAASSRASEERDDLSREIELLQADLELLTQENEQLRADLEESQGIIGARNTREDRAASELSRGTGPEVPHVPSLEDELRGLRVSRDSVSSVTDGPVVRAPKPASAGRADDSEDLDLLFFHFHMTAMSCMSHFSQAGSAGDKMISPATLNTINTMDTRRMYNDAIERGIPPHHWIGYIRDCFAQAHLRSLLKEGGNAYRAKDMGKYKEVRACLRDSYIQLLSAETLAIRI
ncbi:Hypothetical Protein FCC1311_025652 [Hondaea fermentalgiana]|uniref:Uncharacterized protein n=1 Tax=Hondaea fermentalgiana TaxID=2315210 RepID=A0A2R5GET9_9STRA|nr:Hypothetical Protein FCC1311_025652 [Hondaea fermentalgiana]|eukprot:GBG26344.1 Hypothetical Protein FCC1311_025652 [Hondaea fermentalgiana]